MYKKKYIIISLLILLLIIVCFVFINNKDDSKNNNNNVTSNRVIEYDEQTNAYYVKDVISGKILDASRNREELEIYIVNPDYITNYYDNPTIDDFIIHTQEVDN